MLQVAGAALWTCNVSALLASIEQSKPQEVVPPTQRFLIELHEVKFDRIVFELSAPIPLLLYQEDDLWYCEQPDFSILASGGTAERAVYSFCEDFSALWDEIAQARDGSLTKEAVRVKHALSSAVRSVKER